MRISSFLPLLLLAACGKPAESPRNLQETQPPAAAATPGAPAPVVEHIACARGGAAMAPDCTLDRETTARGEVWTIRHPDGSFRRLLVKGDEVSEADGAEPLRAAGRDVTIGDERYRLP